MPKKRTSKRVASIAARVLRNKKASKKSKTLAGTALSQREKAERKKR